MLHLQILHPVEDASRRCGKASSLLTLLPLFAPRLVLPSSSPKWQKNQIDIKMYLGGVVQVSAGFLILISASS